MAQGLRCEEFVHDPSGAGRWDSLTWQELQSPNSPSRCRRSSTSTAIASTTATTSRTACGFIVRSRPASRRRTDAVYHLVVAFLANPRACERLPGEGGPHEARRAGSWPGRSTRCRPRRRSRWSATATAPAWSPARCTAGRRAARRVATCRRGPIRIDRPVRAALVAAAVDANWLRPGGYHGRALEQVDQLLLVNNQLDPAMRFYHMAFEGKGAPAGLRRAGRPEPGRVRGPHSVDRRHRRRRPPPRAGRVPGRFGQGRRGVGTSRRASVAQLQRCIARRPRHCASIAFSRGACAASLAGQVPRLNVLGASRTSRRY